MNVVTASAPGKVIVAGEYAVLDGAPAICMAVNKRARVCISEAEEGQHTVTAPGFRSEPRYFSTIAEATSEFPLLAAVWQQSPPMVDHYLSIVLDSREFAVADNRKLGIGSSAAIAVTLAAALNQISGGNAEVFRTAMQAHRQFQGGIGSGVDIACSMQGGIIEYRMEGNTVTSRSWPQGIYYALLWSGRSADTREQIAKLNAAGSSASRSKLSSAAVNVASIWSGSDKSQILTKLGEYTDALRRFDSDHDLGIFGAGHSELADAAASGSVVYKPCGAGGGDLGIALATGESALEDFVEMASRWQFEKLDLTIDETGVDVKGTVN
jgi:phosphomevalonate kinase